MASFDAFWPKLLRSEGGYVNHPADRGGPTNMGITQATLSRWQGRPASIGQIQTLKVETAKRIYRELYWLPMRGDDIENQQAAELLFDFCVHSGQPNAVRAFQRGAGLQADGVLGPKTMAKLSKPHAHIVLLAARATFLVDVLSDQSQAVFANGWANRLRSFFPLTVSQDA